MDSQLISLDEFDKQYGASSPRRQFLFTQARSVISLLRATGQVKQVFVFGSFVSEKTNPNNIDFLCCDDGQFHHFPFERQNCRGLSK